MKGKEKIIGVIIGVIMAVVASLLGLQSEEIKNGICGVDAKAVAPAAAPAATTAPAEVK